MGVWLERLDKCVSCGCELHADNVEDDPLEVQDAMQARCRMCAREVLGLATGATSMTFNRDTGGGKRVIRSTRGLS